MQFANLPLCLQYHLGLVNTDIAVRMEAKPKYLVLSFY